MRRKTGPRNKAGIASEWDHICEVRERLIQSGLDFSLTGVTAPCIEKYVLRHRLKAAYKQHPPPVLRLGQQKFSALNAAEGYNKHARQREPQPRK